jgi:hypothetical protein
MITLSQYRSPFDRAVRAMQEWAAAQRQRKMDEGDLDEHGQPLTPEFPTWLTSTVALTWLPNMRGRSRPSLTVNYSG